MARLVIVPVTVLLVLAAACGTPRTPTATAHRAVPWADLPAAYEHIPARVIPASPDPAPAEAAPPCTAASVRATADGVGGAGGTLYWSYTFRLSDGPPCAVFGVPSVSTMPTSVPVRPIGPDSSDWTYTHPVLLDGTNTARLRLAWTEDWCAAPVRLDTVRILVSGAAVDVPAPLTSPFCNGGHGPTPIMVWPFAPTHQTGARTVTGWNQVREGPDPSPPPAAAPGGELAFDVTLTATRHDLLLGACPDYRVTFYGAPGDPQERHQLNCAAVPYRRSDGTPYLPARVPVTFEIHARAPAYDAPKAVWELLLPNPIRPVGIPFSAR